MAIQVKNLAVKLQSGTDNTYFAEWKAPTSTVTTTTTTTSSSIKKGSLVSIKSGATWYNGAKIDSWVFNEKWYVYEVSGNRVVLNKNQSGTHRIMSPINSKYLTTGSSSSSGSTTTTTTETVSNLKGYKVVWKYGTGDGIWFEGSNSEVTNRHSTYTPPSQATNICVWVTPVSKTHKVNKKEVSYWTGKSVSKIVYLSNTEPAKPSAPSIGYSDNDNKKYSLKISLENINDVRADKIEFEVWTFGSKKFTSGVSTVSVGKAVFNCKVNPATEYSARCRAINVVTGKKIYSDWSDYSSSIMTMPAVVTNVKCEADSKTSVKITWKAVSTATKYTVEYTNKKEYFNSNRDQVNSKEVTTNTANITGIESGSEYYFRVKATNSAGDSDWSSIVSTVVGTKPQPPTTWSLTTTVGVGEAVILYWTHNSEDGSKQKQAQIYTSINGKAETVTVTSSASEDNDEPIYSYTIDSSKYSDGGEILWMVKTKGVADEYSDWSAQRTVKMYAPPTLSIETNITGNSLTSLPLTFTASTGPLTQTPLSYYISVSAVNAYESVDNVGNTTIVTAGMDIYSKTIISSDKTLTHTISAGDITLESEQSYILTVVAAMDSGLTATSKFEFDVSWVVKDYICDATVTVDKETLSAYISPFCLGEGNALVEGVTLSVYRREADGSFTEIETGLANDMVTTVTDPHPSLDYARYRIVSIDSSNGAVDYSDLPGQPVNEPCIVIQWEEEWSNFDYDEDATPEVPPWTGSMVRLPYNVDVSEKSDPDVSLIEYIGRKNPVSYYGTQRGEGGQWSTEIDKNDVETIYALRRLKSWNGNVYVREPSGIGYWANITVSMSRRHLELTIPVSFSITRVEGGI